MFKGMLICGTNQDSNGTIFILAHALVPREDKKVGYTFSTLELVRDILLIYKKRMFLWILLQRAYSL